MPNGTRTLADVPFLVFVPASARFHDYNIVHAYVCYTLEHSFQVGVMGVMGYLPGDFIAQPVRFIIK